MLKNNYKSLSTMDSTRSIVKLILDRVLDHYEFI